MGANLIRTWTEEEKQKCIELAESGLSGGQIAVILKRPRNSIVGFLFRRKVALNGGRKRSSSKPHQKISENKRVVQRRPPQPPKPKEEPVPVSMPIVRPEGYKPVRFLDSRFGQCMWIMDETVPIKDRMICGEPTKDATCSWCKEHFPVVFIPRSQHKRVIKAFDYGFKKGNRK